MRTPFTAALTLFAVLVAGTALAAPPIVYPVVSKPTVLPYYGSYYGRFARYPGTAYGDYLRGSAAVIRAQGEYNLNTSGAAINLQTAEKLRIENHKFRTQTYFETRAINREFRAKERVGAATAEQIERMAEVGRPDRITASQVDPRSGQINWPAALLGDEYEPQRRRLDALFAVRDQVDSGVDSGLHAQVKALTGEMKDELKQHVREFDATTYMAARRFLESLRYESRFAAETQVADRAEVFAR